MGRELRRVPLDFDWPINKIWDGFENPLHIATKCGVCDGSGSSGPARRLKDTWYGNAPFRPEDRGSTPFLTTDEVIVARATSNVTRSPEYYGRGEQAIEREARRLCGLFNGQWSHHLNDDDVYALIVEGRLFDFTHCWSPKKHRWQPRVPFVLPTAREVNAWSLCGFGHDLINQWICVRAECKRVGVPHECLVCKGEGEHWPSAAAKQAYEDWQPTPPPTGEGFQMWQTVSEGSPISPVFATARELADYLVANPYGIDKGTTAEQWLKFIEGPGWAPSMMGTAETGLMTGVQAVVAEL